MKKRIVLYVEGMEEAGGFAYLTYEDGVYYAEFVKKGGIQYSNVIPQPNRVLIGFNHYLDLTKFVSKGKR